MSRKKQDISYIKPEEPPFLKRIKEQLGYKEGPNVETKRQMPTMDNDADDDGERDDEKPQIVVLNPGDIDEDELAEITKQKEEDEDRKKVEEGKITFIKPTKRHVSNDGEEGGSNTASTKKKKSVDSTTGEKPKVTSKAVSESRLLSFGDDGE